MVALLLSTIIAVLAQQPDCQIYTNDCSWYERCAERANACGPKGYALGYAQRYCQKFSSASMRFSPQGQAWIPKVMSCLQSALLPYTQQQLTCPQIKSIGFKSHAGCYVETGFCDLPKRDWLAAAIVIRDQVFDIDGHITAGEVLRKCYPPLGPSK